MHRFGAFRKPTQQVPGEPASLRMDATRWMIGVVVDAEVQRTAELSDPGLCLKLSVRRSRFRDHNFASLVRFPTVGVGVL